MPVVHRSMWPSMGMKVPVSDPRDLRVAVVQDWFPTYGGAERVTEQILKVLPQADVFGLVDALPEDQRAFLQGKRVTTSFIQRLPLARTKYRYYLPLMPLAIEQFDFGAYDLVVSSSNAFAKGVITGPDQVHISYVHSPMRFAWDLQHQYLRQTGLDRGPASWFVRWQLQKLRQWDSRTVDSVDVLLANSEFVRRRIWKVYRRAASVLFPPVDVDRFTVTEKKEDFFVTVSRLVPYKRVDLIVDAFNHMPDKPLYVVGDGPELPKIARMAGANVHVLGYQREEMVSQMLQRARAFVFAAEEDFGIAPVEAQAAGTPVIAFGKGGALDTVVTDIGRPTGLFFYQQTPEALCDAVERFEVKRHELSPLAARAQAERFGAPRFRRAFADVVRQALAQDSSTVPAGPVSITQAARGDATADEWSQPGLHS